MFLPSYNPSIEYLPIIVIIFLAFFISCLILFASFFLSYQTPNVEKSSLYECGFDSYEDSRNKFNVKFYIVSILFIIFDLETIFLFPWCISLSTITSSGFWFMFEFLLELIVGFVYIWLIGALDWK